jgi:hypothetical protein
LKDTSQEDDRTVQNCTLRTENDTPPHSDKVFAVCTHLSLPDSPIQEESNAGPTVPLFTIAHPPEKDSTRSSFGRVFSSPQSLTMHPLLHEDKDKRGACSASKTRQRVCKSETSPRLVQELGRRSRCACEAWRCEFVAGSKQCDSAAEQGKCCLAHLAFQPQ